MFPLNWKLTWNKSTGLSRNVHFRISTKRSRSRYFYLHAQHWRSRLHRNVWQVGPELLGRNSVLRFGGMFHRFFISWLLHQVMNSDHSLFVFVGWEENPNTFLTKFDDSWRTHWDWQRGWANYLECFFKYSQWWGKGKGEDFSASSGLRTNQETPELSVGKERFRPWWWRWFPLSNTEKKTHHRWLSWKTWIPNS